MISVRIKEAASKSISSLIPVFLEGFTSLHVLVDVGDKYALMYVQKIQLNTNFRRFFTEIVVFVWLSNRN